VLTSLTVTPSSTVAKKFSLPIIGTLKKTQQKHEGRIQHLLYEAPHTKLNI